MGNNGKNWIGVLFQKLRYILEHFWCFTHWEGSNQLGILYCGSNHSCHMNHPQTPMGKYNMLCIPTYVQYVIRECSSRAKRWRLCHAVTSTTMNKAIKSCCGSSLDLLKDMSCESSISYWVTLLLFDNQSLILQI